MRWVVGAGIVAIPAIAYASTGGDPTALGTALSAVSLAVQTYVATRITPLERRVQFVERRIGDIERGIIR